jgi:hypothetical protein
MCRRIGLDFDVGCVGNMGDVDHLVRQQKSCNRKRNEEIL